MSKKKKPNAEANINIDILFCIIGNFHETKHLWKDDRESSSLEPNSKHFAKLSKVLKNVDGLLLWLYLVRIPLDSTAAVEVR